MNICQCGCAAILFASSLLFAETETAVSNEQSVLPVQLVQSDTLVASSDTLVSKQDSVVLNEPPISQEQSVSNEQPVLNERSVPSGRPALEKALPEVPPKTVLYLGGGAYSPWYSLGVLYAIRDYRVPIDSVVGTSWGAVIGSLWSQGFELDDIQRFITDSLFVSQVMPKDSAQDSLLKLPVSKTGTPSLAFRFAFFGDSAGYAHFRSKTLDPDSVAVKRSLFRFQVQEALTRADSNVVPFTALACKEGKLIPSTVSATLPFSEFSGEKCPTFVPQDSAFAANFAVNIYNVSVTSNNSTMGDVLGGGSYNYLSTATLSATANYGYHFVQWSDGTTSNPRTFTVVSDSAFVAQFVANSYSVSVSSNDTAMGTVYGGGLYNYNTTASLSAVPAYGYHFVQWSDGDTSNPRSVTVVGNASYTAQFAVNIYSVSVTSSNAAMGTASGGGNFVHGATTYITATAAYGYRFTQWNDGNTDNPRLITVTQNANYVAQFAINSYTVSATANNSALGNVTGGGVYVYNTQTTLTATPFYGFYFVQWSDGNTDNPRTITVTSDLNLVAQFDSIDYLLSATSSNYAAGNVVGGGSYAYLSQVTITAVPMPHYHFVQWSDSSTVNPRVVTLTSDTSFVAQFAVDTHSVAVYSEDTVQGYVLGSGSWAYGTVTYITAQSNYGYHFTHWSDGNVQNPRRVVVASDTMFTAQFDYNTYSVVLSANDTALGVTTGAGSYYYLSSVMLTATPVGNSRFVGWSDGVLDNPRTLVLTCDTSITANFISNNCSILCQANDSTMGVVVGAGVYDYLSQAVIRAVPNNRYHFVRWDDGLTTNPRIVTVLHDSSFTAIFAADDQYQIVALSNNDSLGSVSGGGYYYYGDQAVLTAEPAERAYFVQWSDGIVANPRAVQVISDQEYTAIFASETFSVSLSANYPDQGALYGDGDYTYGQEAVLTAVAFPGVEFLGWSDGNNENPRTVVVVSDTSFQALFRDLLGIDDAEGENCVISVDRRTILVKGAANHSVSVYDLYGRRITYLPHMGESASIPVFSAGVYIVQVDGMRAKKLVVM